MSTLGINSQGKNASKSNDTPITTLAGGGDVIACRVVAPGGWLSVMGKEFGRFGRSQPFFNHAQILQRSRINYS